VSVHSGGTGLGQMFTVVLGAVRSRTPQALMVLILAALPAAAAGMLVVLAGVAYLAGRRTLRDVP